MVDNNFNKVLDCILSSENTKQLKSCLKLIDNYENLLQKKHYLTTYDRSKILFLMSLTYGKISSFKKDLNHYIKDIFKQE